LIEHAHAYLQLLNKEQLVVLFRLSFSRIGINLLKFWCKRHDSMIHGREVMVRALNIVQFILGHIAPASPPQIYIARQ